MKNWYLTHIVLTGLLTVAFLGVYVPSQAAPRQYQCELALQGGLGYYAGDATEHVFNHVRETYGAHFRYKFDQRWALQVKGLHHRITGPMLDEKGNQLLITGEKKPEMWENRMINLDVVAEFNFFRLGETQYDRRVKPYTPYMFLGLGMSLYGDKYRTAACYLPVGIGFKWKFADRWGLDLAWQHNIYMADNIEGVKSLDNTFNLNGANIMNMDITSQITFGIVFEFAREKQVCRTCGYY